MPESTRVSPSPDVYDESYYLRCCEGATEFVESMGARLTEARARTVARAAGSLANARVLDVGAGRGELVGAALERGARLAVGIDFSSAAVQLARGTVAGNGVAFVRGDARNLPLGDRSVDVVFCTDVIEHLVADEAARMLEEIWRVLAPGGLLVLHTTPNRWWQRYGYYIFYALSPTHRRRYGTLDATSATADATHVNEQSPRSLGRALRRAGFTFHVELEDFNLQPTNRLKRALIRLLTRSWPLRLFCANHLFAAARKAEAPSALADARD
jgi:ubiquinone/menaquinone biosynthesis C-methylase UbiE